MQLAQITPMQQLVAQDDSSRSPRILTNKQKAAVIVRLMLSEGAPIGLAGLPEHLQAALAEQMGHMRLVDRQTMNGVVEEFVKELEEVGLSFPSGIDNALTLMDGHISATAASRLRRLAGASSKADPWDRIIPLPNERLKPVLEQESPEVAAVMLSKLPVPKAAELLGSLPGDKARRIACAVSATSNVDPETVRRIGLSLAAQLDMQPARAFDTGPVERVGAILNATPQATRDEVLAGLEEADAPFAELVRRAIFTWVHIPARVEPRDIPKIVRIVPQPVLVTALTAAMTTPDGAVVAEFFLSNMSQRMAQSLREEVGQRGRVKDKDAEIAQAEVIASIRSLEASRELALIQPEDD